jgi:5-methylcytosine-specific restriction protein A
LQVVENKKNDSMKTFLFAWNPDNWKWTTLEQTFDFIELTGRATEKWSVKSHKKIQPGDRAFLIRLGVEPKGIMGAGFVSTQPFLSKHWSGKDKLVYKVMIDFEVLLNPTSEPLLSLDSLKQGELAKVNWTPQSSGIEIQQEFVNEFEALWFDFLNTQNIRNNPFMSSEKENQKAYTEGKLNQVTVTKYERNPFARKSCIDHYGLFCVVCGLNFQQEYGEIGRDFIHVHHLRQIATIGKEYIINPINDLRPVCPNCHAMIHKRIEPFTIEEIKERIKKPATNFC